MAQYWFFLTDPETYSLDQIFQKPQDVWDGVHGANAQRYLREIQKGDRILGYHTAPEKRVYALLEAVSDAYADPKEVEKTVWVADVKGVRKFARPVPLPELRENAKLAQMKFLRIARLAVSPLSAAEYKEILRMAGENP